MSHLRGHHGGGASGTSSGTTGAGSLNPTPSNAAGGTPTLPRDRYYQERQASINVPQGRVVQLRQFFNSIFRIWFENARRRRKMQFAATLIQWAYRRHLRWIAALELDACSRIEVAFVKYLRRRNTRTYWLGVDFKTVSRDTLQWVLRAAGKRWEGKREELEQRMHDYVYEFRLISEKAEEERREHLRLTLESTGTIYAFGANYDGQLGDGGSRATNNPRYNPAVAGKGVVRVVAGMDCTNCFAVTGTGELFTWGGGGHHPAAGLDVQVMERKFGGDWYRQPRRVDGGLHRAPDAEEKWAARMIEASAASAGVVGGDGQPQAHNASQPATTDAPSSGTQGGVSEETALQLSSNVVDVSPGTEHCVASIREGGCFSWGQNIYEQTGRERTSETSQAEPRWIGKLQDDRVVQMSSCARCTMAVTDTGQVVVWGASSQTKSSAVARVISYPGQRKKPDEQRLLVIPRFNSFGVMAWQVSCGQSHAAVVSRYGRLYTWGDGAGGRLGLGDTRSRQTPELVASLAHKVVLSVCCAVWHSAAIVHVPGVSLPVGQRSPWRDTDIAAATRRRLGDDADVAAGSSGEVPAQAGSGQSGSLPLAAAGNAAGSQHPLVQPEPSAEALVAAGADDGGSDSGGSDGSFRFVAPPEKSRAEKEAERRMLEQLLGGGRRSSAGAVSVGAASATNSVADLFSAPTMAGLRPASPPEKPRVGGREARAAWAEQMAVREADAAGAEERLLPDHSVCVTPATPAGALYTWGTGTSGQLAQRTTITSMLPKPVQWATELELSRPVADRIELMGDPHAVPGLVQSLEARRKGRWKEASRLQRERQLYSSRHEWGVLPVDQRAWYKRQRRRRRLRKRRQAAGTGADDAEGGGAGAGAGSSDEEEEDGAVLVQAVSCGALHCAAIDTRGAVFTWGCDQSGCLGRDITAGFEFKAPPFAGAAFTSTFRAAATQQAQGKHEALLRRQALDRTTRRTYTAMVGSLGASSFAATQRKVRRGAAVDGVAAAMEAASGLGGLLYSRGDAGRVSRCDGGGQVGGRADAVSQYYSGAMGGGADLSSKHGRYLARMDAMSAAATSARTRGSNAPGTMVAHAHPMSRGALQSSASRHSQGRVLGSKQVLRRAADGLGLVVPPVAHGELLGPLGLPIRPTHYTVGHEHVALDAWTDPSRLKRPLVPQRGYDRRLLALHLGSASASVSDTTAGAARRPLPMAEWMDAQERESKLAKDGHGGVARPAMQWGDLGPGAAAGRAASGTGGEPLKTWYSTSVPGRVQGLAGVYAGRVCSVTCGKDFTVAATLPLTSPWAVVPSHTRGEVVRAATGNGRRDDAAPPLQQAVRGGGGAAAAQPLVDPVVAAAKARAKRRAARRHRRFDRALRRQLRRERAARRRRRRGELQHMRRARQRWREERRVANAARLAERYARRDRRVQRRAARRAAAEQAAVRARMVEVRREQRAAAQSCQVWEARAFAPLRYWRRLGGRYAIEPVRVSTSVQQQAHLAATPSGDGAAVAVGTVRYSLPLDPGGLHWFQWLGGVVMEVHLVDPADDVNATPHSGRASHSSRASVAERLLQHVDTVLTWWQYLGGRLKTHPQQVHTAPGHTSSVAPTGSALSAASAGSAAAGAVSGSGLQPGDDHGLVRVDGGGGEDSGHQHAGEHDSNSLAVGGGAQRRHSGSRSPRSGSRSPRSGSRSPRSGSRSPRSGSRSPRSGSRSPRSGSRSPRSGSRSPRSGSSSSRSGSGSSRSSSRSSRSSYSSGHTDRGRRVARSHRRSSGSSGSSTTSGGSIRTGSTPSSLRSPDRLPSDDDRDDDQPRHRVLDGGSVGTASLHSSDWSSHTDSTVSSNTSSDESVFDYTASPRNAGSRPPTFEAHADDAAAGTVAGVTGVVGAATAAARATRHGSHVAASRGTSRHRARGVLAGGRPPHAEGPILASLGSSGEAATDDNSDAPLTSPLSSFRSLPARLPPLASASSASVSESARGDTGSAASAGATHGNAHNASRQRSASAAAVRQSPRSRARARTGAADSAAVPWQSSPEVRVGKSGNVRAQAPAPSPKRAHRDSQLRVAAESRLKLSRSLRRLLSAPPTSAAQQLLTARTDRDDEASAGGDPVPGVSPSVSPRTAAAVADEQRYQRQLMALRRKRAEARHRRQAGTSRKQRKLRGRRLAAALAAGRSKSHRDARLGSPPLASHRVGATLSARSGGSLSVADDDDDASSTSGVTHTARLQVRPSPSSLPAVLLYTVFLTCTAYEEPTATRTRRSASVRRRHLGSTQGAANTGTSGSSVTDAMERRRRVAARRLRAITAGHRGDDELADKSLGVDVGMSRHPYARPMARRGGQGAGGEVSTDELQRFARPPCRACKCTGYLPNPLSLFRCRVCMHARRQHGDIPLPDAESQERAVIRIQRMFRNRLPRLLLHRLVSAVSKVYIKTLDPKTGAFFYFNTRTEETSWEPPQELALLTAQGVDIPITEYPPSPPAQVTDEPHSDASSTVSSLGSDSSLGYDSAATSGSASDGD